MFIQQLHEFNFRAGRYARLARVDVELEQSANTIDLWTIDGEVQRRDVVVVDRVLINAIQRTQQLARARLANKRCAMQRRPTVFL